MCDHILQYEREGVGYVSSASVGAQQWPTLFSSGRLRGRAIATGSCPRRTRRGGVTRAARRPEVEYQVRKAAGGCGLVMTFGSASVDPTTAASYGSVALWDERNEPALRALAARVHEHGALCMSQMTHMGRRGHSQESGSRCARPRMCRSRCTARCRSRWRGRDPGDRRALRRRRRSGSRRCGWDGCEVTSLGGHLIEQFFDPPSTRAPIATAEPGEPLRSRARCWRRSAPRCRIASSSASG